MCAEISYDLIMTDEMAFVEGTYRLDRGEWQVFIFIPNEVIDRPTIKRNATWESGVQGIYVETNSAFVLNKTSVEKLLSETLGVSEWLEVRGPDSIVLR